MTVPPQRAQKFTLHLHQDRPASVLVSTDGVKENAVFLPKSDITISPERIGSQIVVLVPDWLVVREGLLAKAGAGQGNLF